MKIYCTNCGDLVPAQNLDIKKAEGACTTCNRKFLISEAVISRLDTSDKKTALSRTGIRVDENEQRLQINIKWRPLTNSKPIFISGLILLGFPLCIFSVFLFAETDILGINFIDKLLFTGTKILFLLASSLVSVPGGLMLVKTYINYVNRTRIEVDQDFLKITHVPYDNFMHKSRTYLRSDITQLSVKRYTIGQFINKSIYHYRLNVKLKDGKHKCILNIFKNLKDARHVEQLLENYLNLEKKNKNIIKLRRRDPPSIDIDIEN